MDKLSREEWNQAHITTVREPKFTDKYCPGCRLVKSLDEWPKNRSKYDGYGSYCKDCNRKRTAASRAKKGH
jgi:transposase-like protein